MDNIFIQDLIVRGVLGVDACERTKPQEIRINVSVFTDTRLAAHEDDIEKTIDYRELSEKIRAYAEYAQSLTVEAFAEGIARLCLKERNAKKAHVRVEKPHAIQNARSAGVEIERTKSDFNNNDSQVDLDV